MILRARTVVPISAEPIDDGAVVVEGNKITGVGAFAEIRRTFSGEILDLGERVLLPGLINAHCHLDYTVLRGKIPPQESFAAWIRTINAEKAQLSDQDYVDSIKAGFAEAARFGTTTIANLTAFPKLAAAVEEPIRTWWFGELIDVRNPDNADSVADEAAELLRFKENWGLAPHAPFTASPRLYARCEEIGRKEGIPLTTHLAESREEMQMFRDAKGAAYEFIKGLGRPMDDCGRETPFSLFGRIRKLDQHWIVAHLNELDPSDLDVLAKVPKFHIAHSPRSHRYFSHSPFAFEKLRDLGFNICLGTDSLASNADLSLFAEMREFFRKNAGVSPRDALEMATENGAAALGQRDRLGCIRAGAFADLIALPISTGDIFENIVAFSGDVRWMMANGVVTSPS
jgi:cytosine/adenosine deaminase-related metal-dependent hydrolase